MGLRRGCAPGEVLLVRLGLGGVVVGPQLGDQLRGILGSIHCQHLQRCDFDANRGGGEVGGALGCQLREPTADDSIAALDLLGSALAAHMDRDTQRWHCRRLSDESEMGVASRRSQSWQ